ncbi:MAG: hypothetical protein ACJ76P_11850 [Actinomycetota bacterium]
MRRVTIVATGVLIVLAMASGAQASTQVVDRKSGRGDYAVATAGGNVRHPKRLWVKVTSRPHERVYVSWTDTCGKGFGAGSKSGHFRATTAVKRRIKMPYHRPDSCSVAATGQLQNKGRKITVTILARV